MSIKKTPALAAVFVVLFSFCAAAIAQVTTGSVLGTVRDTSGAVIPGATVTVTDTGKGTTIANAALTVTPGLAGQITGTVNDNRDLQASATFYF